MKRQEKRILFLVTVFVFTLLCFVPGQKVRAVVNNEVVDSDEYIEKMLRALQEKDKDSIKQLWPEGMDYETIAAMIEGWDEREVVSYTKIKEEKRPAEGEIPSGTMYWYLVDCEDTQLTIQMSIADDEGDGYKIDCFNVHGNYKTGANQWDETGENELSPSLVYGILFFIFEVLVKILTSIHCYRQKKKYYALWIVFIIFTDISISLGSIEIGLPLGVIIYWIKEVCQRKKEKEKFVLESAEQKYIQTIWKILEQRDVDAFGKLWMNNTEWKILEKIIDRWNGRKVLSWVKQREEVRPSNESELMEMFYEFQVEFDDSYAKVNLATREEEGDIPNIAYFDFQYIASK